MKKSASLTFLVIAGLVLFSLVSCGGSGTDKQSNTVGTKSEDLKQYAQSDYSDSEYEDWYSEDEKKDVQKDAVSSTTFKPFPVYTDGKSPDNHYIPSGYMGDYTDVQMNLTWFEGPHSGTTCIKAVYNNKASHGARWSGVFWQNPANNWGDRKGGFDLTGAKKLVFWAKGEEGEERIEEFKIGGITGLYSDSDSAGIGPVVLTTEWKQYEIDLEGKDLSYISGGFCWSTNLDANSNGVTFYLDDIRYE